MKTDLINGGDRNKILEACVSKFNAAVKKLMTVTGRKEPDIPVQMLPLYADMKAKWQATALFIAMGMPLNEEIKESLEKSTDDVVKAIDEQCAAAFN